MESEHDPARPPRFLDLAVLAIEADGTEQRIGGRQLATILGVLLVDADRHVSVDRLLDALWPDGAGSTSTLDSHLHRLRKLIEPSRRRGAAPTVLLSEARGYRLVVSPPQVDSLRFEQLVSDAGALHGRGELPRAIRRCDDALSLWRGTPYSPVDDQDWAVPAVGRLTERLAQVSELRLICLLGVGEAGTALAESTARSGGHTDADGAQGRRPVDGRAGLRSHGLAHGRGVPQQARRDALPDACCQCGPGGPGGLLVDRLRAGAGQAGRGAAVAVRDQRVVGSDQSDPSRDTPTSRRSAVSGGGTQGGRPALSSTDTVPAARLIGWFARDARRRPEGEPCSLSPRDGSRPGRSGTPAGTNRAGSA